MTLRLLKAKIVRYFDYGKEVLNLNIEENPTGTKADFELYNDKPWFVVVKFKIGFGTRWIFFDVQIQHLFTVIKIPYNFSL